MARCINVRAGSSAPRSEYVMGDVLTVNGRSYHPDHVRCGVCSMLLGDESSGGVFVGFDGWLLCRAHDEEARFAGVCGGCG